MQRPLSAILAACALAACGEPPPSASAGASRPAPQLQPPVVRAAALQTYSAMEEESDPARSLAAKVKRALEADKDVHAAAIDVTVTPGGVVTLWGTADSEDERLLAARIAYRIAGVNKVLNRLAIARGS